MGRNRKIPCDICSKSIRGDNMKQHMRSHGIGKEKSIKTMLHHLVSYQSSGVRPSSYGISPETVRNCGGVSSSVQKTSECSKKLGEEKVIYGKARDINKQESNFFVNKCNSK